MQILQETQRDLKRESIETGEFTHWIILMSMFNDIDWTRKGNDGICVSNSEKVKAYAKRLSQGLWTFVGPGDEKKWFETLRYTFGGKWDSTATRWNDSKKPVFKSISASIHFNADASNTELLSRIIHSVNQLNIYGAVSNWCEQFGTRENETRREKPLGKGESVTIGVLTSVKSLEVNFLVSSSRLVSGSSARENIQDFESLSETIRLTRV